MITVYESKIRIIDEKYSLILTNTKTSADRKKTTKSPIDYFKLKDPKHWDNLKDVFNSLVKNIFIKDDNKTLTDFKNIFTEKLIEKKIEWIGAAVELQYFINQLFPKVEELKEKHWEVTLLYFEGKTKDEKQFDRTVLRGAKNISDSRKKILDNIFSQFLILHTPHLTPKD